MNDVHIFVSKQFINRRITLWQAESCRRLIRFFGGRAEYPCNTDAGSTEPFDVNGSNEPGSDHGGSEMHHIEYAVSLAGSGLHTASE